MPTTMKLIAKSVLGSAAASVVFDNIPGTYTDLLVLVSGRSARVTITDNLMLRPNGSTSSLSSRRLGGTGSAAVSYNSTTLLYCFELPGANATASTFGNGSIYIPNYAGSTNKSVSCEGAMETNGSEAYITCSAGLWSSTSAITSLTLISETSNNIVSGSSFFLYGITKA